MKVFYIAELNINQKGGLFNATYERLKRHNILNYCFVVNNNSYDSSSIRFFKKILGKDIKSSYKLKEFSKYDEITINNLNFKKSLKTYLHKKTITELKDEVVEYYLKKYRIELNEADVIHAHWGYPNGYIAYKISQTMSKPYFITFHGSDINYLNKFDYSDMILAMENAYNCFFVSEKLLENAKKIGYSGANAKIIYNGVDLNNFMFKDKDKSSLKTIGFVGALIHKKGADLLPQIFNEIKQRSKVDVRFLIVGNGELVDKLKFEFKQLRDLQVDFTGNIEPINVPQVMSDIDVLIVPSRNEGFGMVILEANAMGIPAVGTRVGGIPEAIGNEENIIEFDDNLVENMACRVIQLLKEDTRKIKDYRKRIDENFNWCKVVKEENLSYEKSLTLNKSNSTNI